MIPRWALVAIGAALLAVLTVTAFAVPRLRPERGGGPATPSGVPVGTAAPGDVVGVLDAGGQQQFVDCRGTGGPTVVLVSGVEGWSKDWAPVVDPLRSHARVCTYDRPGLGDSPARSGSTDVDAGSHAAELVALLAAAGEKGPFLLVGHSYGGLIVRALQHAHPDLVAGMVLLDPVPPRFADAYPAFGRFRREGGTTIDYDASAAATGGDGSLARVPLVVLAAGAPLSGDPAAAKQAWLAAQRRTANASRDSLDLVAVGAGHQLQDYATQAVLAAVAAAEQAVRAGARLPGCDATAWARVGASCAR